MAIYQEISEALQKGKKNDVVALVTKALEDKLSPEDILGNGLLAGMEIVGERFKNNEVYVPEVLIAARAMNAGAELLKQRLLEDGVQPLGKVILGTVKGDLHDIGKNLVKLMLEGKGLEVIDLGVDVTKEMFYEAYVKEGAKLVACSALLTTTMGEMKTVVDYFTEMGARDNVTIMIGGAPITDSYRESIGADLYASDAATAADLAKAAIMSNS